MDEPVPGLQQSMARQHAGDDHAGGSTVPVARMLDGRPRDQPPDTVDAWSPVAEERGARADEAVVVDRLDDRHSLVTGGVVAGWRDQWKRVVEMDYVRAKRPEHLAKVLVGAPAPERR